MPSQNPSGDDRTAAFRNVLGNVRRPQRQDDPHDTDTNRDDYGATPDGAIPVMVSVQKVFPNRGQPRKHFDRHAMEGLRDSVCAHGILQPLLVRPGGAGSYEVISGERRLKAAKEAGLSQIPVTIKEVDDHDSARLLALIENLQREDLNTVEETEGVLSVLELSLQYSRQEVLSVLYRLARTAREEADDESSQAAEGTANNVIGSTERSEHAQDAEDVHSQVRRIFNDLGENPGSFVNNKLPLLNLPEEVLTAVRERGLDYTKARILARVEDPEYRSALLTETINQHLTVTEIRRRVAAARNAADEQDPTGVNEPAKELGSRASKLGRKMNRSTALTDTHKARRAGELLDELEALLQE